MLDAAAERREGLLVTEVAAAYPAIEAEHQVGAALVLAERLDEHVRCRPAAAPKYGVDRERRRSPAPSARGHADGGQPVGDRAARRAPERRAEERRAPRRRRTSRSARRAPSRTRRVTARNRVTVSPTTNAHPARRQRRLSHGAAAAMTALTAASPAAVGKERLGQRTDVVVRSSTDAVGAGRELLEQEGRTAAATAATETVARNRHRPVQHGDRGSADQDDDGEQPGAGDDDLDDPVRQGPEATEEVGGERRERVAEQPLQQQEGARAGPRRRPAEAHRPATGGRPPIRCERHRRLQRRSGTRPITAAPPQAPVHPRGVVRGAVLWAIVTENPHEGGPHLSNNPNDPLGPIDFLVVEFPGNKFNGRVLPGAHRPHRQGPGAGHGPGVRRQGRRRQRRDGRARGSPQRRRRRALQGLAAFIADVVSEEDLNSIADELQPNSSAAVLMWENTVGGAVRRSRA